MALFSGNRPIWGQGFLIDRGERDGYIRLAQKGRSTFQLESVIEYGGDTGLEALNLSEAALTKLRRLDPEDLDDTDLASVPAPMRWWVNTYGSHTPAALIHDRFIGGELPEGVSEAHIDRYFRFMLKDSGVTILKRWIIWSAVALRTRWQSGGLRRLSVAVWLIVALVSFAATIGAAVAGNWWLVAILAVPAPLVAAAAWGHQYGAGVIAAYVVLPFLVVPMVMSVTMLAPFWLVEKAVTSLLEGGVQHEPIWEPLERSSEEPVVGLDVEAAAI